MNSAQSACKLKSLQQFHINQFNGKIPASEVFIPNPVHNLMAFESLPLPPGWQVVHLDLIESIYILHKWKAHGGLPTWFWSATELGEPHFSEYAQCQQGIHYTAEWEGEGGWRGDTFWYYFWLKCNSVWVQLPPSHVFLSVCQFSLRGWGLNSCVIFYHKGESDNTNPCITGSAADENLPAFIYNWEEKSWDLKYSNSTCQDTAWHISKVFAKLMLKNKYILDTT